MKYLSLVTALLLVACDDTIPGTCNVDSDCTRWIKDRVSVCLQGLCLPPEATADGGDASSDAGGDSDAGAPDAGTGDGGSPAEGDGGAEVDAAVQDAAVQDAGPGDGAIADAGSSDTGGGGESGDAGPARDGGGGALGAACSSATQCASGSCADGVCCDTPCNDKTCQRCDGNSTSGAGHCGFAKEGSDLDRECPLPVTSCSGKCKLVTTTASCTGTTYSCSYQQKTVAVPSGQICSSNAATRVSKDEYCSSARGCIDSNYQASSWWTSCNGQGDCRSADDKTDAALATLSCGDYLCDPAALQCRSRCYSDSECVPGTICSDSSCVWSFAWANWPVSSTKSYTKTAGGTVIDNVTKLEWLPGLAYSQPVNWSTARTLCGASWRLPNPIELLSILDPSKESGIDPILGTPGTPYYYMHSPDLWTSLPVAGDSGSAWVVTYKGFPRKAPIGETKWIRCMRVTTP